MAKSFLRYLITLVLVPGALMSSAVVIPSWNKVSASKQEPQKVILEEALSPAASLTHDPLSSARTTVLVTLSRGAREALGRGGLKMAISVTRSHPGRRHTTLEDVLIGGMGLPESPLQRMRLFIDDSPAALMDLAQERDGIFIKLPPGPRDDELLRAAEQALMARQWEEGRHLLSLIDMPSTYVLALQTAIAAEALATARKDLLAAWKSFADRLTLLFNEDQRSKPQIAEDSKMSYGLLRNLWHGIAFPEPGRIEDLARAFAIAPETLFPDFFHFHLMYVRLRDQKALPPKEDRTHLSEEEWLRLPALLARFGGNVPAMAREANLPHRTLWARIRADEYLKNRLMEAREREKYDYLDRIERASRIILGDKSHEFLSAVNAWLEGIRKELTHTHLSLLHLLALRAEGQKGIRLQTSLGISTSWLQQLRYVLRVALRPSLAGVSPDVKAYGERLLGPRSRVYRGA